MFYSEHARGVSMSTHDDACMNKVAQHAGNVMIDESECHEDVPTMSGLREITSTTP